MSTTTVIVLCAAVVALLVLWFWRHQRALVKRAAIMQEAIRNHDLTFQLPTRHMFSGERALQETLNQLGEHIREQVNLGEVESWEKLTRVLTHEIMNATAPIASISQSMLHHPAVQGTDLEEGINAIHNTVVHLNSFVDGYRKYSALQKPLPKMVNLGEIVGDVSQLFSEVTWKNNLTSDIIIKTDPNLLRQILINLIKNAIEAGARTIGVDCERGNEGKVLLSVSNDGALIPAEARSSIFIPFFTTKRKGNGIGLSLSRRLLTLQGGMMSLLDHPRAGFHTTFLLEFPA
ncbi:MAG: HAMP domain-containing histidine kinase [Muribaculaceae bacterium]|jgi:signal transduction histidine kinase|nr:HAMP domain-containing histidine kinase [Muribaculaceae bacterium]